MNYWAGAEWSGDDVVLVEEPVYDWDCPDGYFRDDWGQCVPEVREVFVIEREILYLYPDLVATYPDLQLHPEFLFRYRPELRTRYANVRSVSDLRNRYTSYHHASPPQRPASAPHESAKAQRGAKTPGAPPSKLAQPSRGQPSAQASMKSPAPPSYGAPSTQPPAHAGPPVQPPAHVATTTQPPSPHGPPATSPAQHAALTSPSPKSPAGPVSKDKTATSGLFTPGSPLRTHPYMVGAVCGAVFGLVQARNDDDLLPLSIAGAAGGAIVFGLLAAGASMFERRRAAQRVGYYVPGLFPETREWLENEF